MSTTILELTPHDPLIARDGRPFGAGQGNRMHSLSWLLPSVVAGSFRTTLIKATPDLDFSHNMPQRLMQIQVAGVFPTVDDEIYFPAPQDALTEPVQGSLRIRSVHRLTPQGNFGGCDFPDDHPLRPVMLSEKQAKSDFKPAALPVWWPLKAYSQWLAGEEITFDQSFLNAPIQETREHVSLDPDRGAAAEGQIFSTCGLNVTHMPRYSEETPPERNEMRSFTDRYAAVSLACRVTTPDSDFKHVKNLDIWHPMGGERRLVHWKPTDQHPGWSCPEKLSDSLANASRIRMVLTTPAIFQHGWRPDWIDKKSLTGQPFENGPTLKLVGVTSDRWKAVSGWSLAPPRGPKPVRRLVPEGSVYFFEKIDGDTELLATTGWLQSVSDELQDRNDGFGLASWGVW